MKKPFFGSKNPFAGMKSESHKLIRHCEVTAVLVLYGLPRSGSSRPSARTCDFYLCVVVLPSGNCDTKFCVAIQVTYWIYSGS